MQTRKGGRPEGKPGEDPEVSLRSPRFQTRIPKEAGVGVGVGLTIAEKL